MRFFLRYIFPALFGLLIYASIRLVTDTTSNEKFWNRPIQQNLVEIISIIVLGYIIEGILRFALKKFNSSQKQFHVRNVILEFGILLLGNMIMMNPILILIHYLANDPIDWADIIIANIIVSLYVLLYYAIVRGNGLIKAHIEQQTQMERLKTVGAQLELNFLRAQFHPHFLFNALNTIYFQMDESVPEAKQTVEKFSELLRYQLYDQQQVVSVTQELQHLQNFIYLQKSRSSDKLQITINIDPKLNAEKLYPLLLLPLVENAFKYVGGDYNIVIEATKDDTMLRFYVVNSIPAQQQNFKDGGIGLDNLQRRLQLLYPDRHSFSVAKTANQFTAELKLAIS